MKTMYIQTNYNNKLGCKAFIHIDRAPKVGIPSRDLGSMIEIRTADNSHPPVKKIIYSLIRFKLGETYDTQSIPSHGLSADEFIDWWKEQFQEGEGTELAVYYYRDPEFIVSS